MPTYLVHGFRWRRDSIVIHTILQDLEDAAPNWIMAPRTSISMLNSFYSMYDFLPPSSPPPATYSPPVPQVEKPAPEPKKENNGPRTLTKANKGSMSSLRSLGRKNKPPNLGSKGTNGHTASTSSSDSRPSPSTQTSACEVKKEPRFNEWSVVKLLEQYDPEDIQTASQPYAYVADYMVEVKLGVSLNEEMFKYEADQKAEEAILNAHNAPPTPGTPASPAPNAIGGMTSPSLSIREARRRSRRLGWFEKLRDGLQKEADIGWYVVVCGDEERMVPTTIEEESEDESEEERHMKSPRSAGLRGMFHKRKDILEEE
ncbi:uncharacterized protein LY89DRAFT_684910 [Mollisia scopiformis]|uniref:Developmental regulator protein n=1 Tax=Mollisia scopiformis TaxID=149040 RepID=A0A194X9P1_MOLSC|nr:uncharacterized protein LY89DRAFT_684910 [Mollisia scopiformis]KUJ16905.1 hypothetical protein LY89DRAFT_684910 [Mollisia scopiformis]